MKGLRVGHYTNLDKMTGTTVFLFDKPAIGAYCLCGSSPASHELATLELEANVTHIDGLVFLGGSSLGLPAIDGVLRWFNQEQRGWKMPHGRVPIVPTCALYDLALVSAFPPTADEAFQACMRAVEDNSQSGRVGAGTGATIGKLIANANRMSGGLGQAQLELPNGVLVSATVVVNSVGDVYNNGAIIAGARWSNGEFANTEKLLLSGHSDLPSAANTTLVALFTNAKFSKIELKRIAKMGVAGIARAISPIFSRYDGDLIFAISVGEMQASEVVIGTMAAEVIRLAIVDAVKHSIVIEG